MARTGRRRGDSGTRGAILAAARTAFAAHGYDRTSVRGIARAAGVDQALVHHFFGTKAGLFAAALQLPANPADVLDGLLAGPREDVTRQFLTTLLSLWDAPDSRAPALALLRSAATQEQAAELVRELFRREVITRLARLAGDGPDAELRAALAASQVMGLVVARYVLELEPLASAAPEDLVAAVAPVLDAHLGVT